MITYKKLTDDYIATSKKWGVDRQELTLSQEPDNHGQEHIEISDENKISLITTERGKITKKRTTESKDELLYWIFADEAFGKGWGYSMKNRVEGEDFRRAAFKYALSEISKLSDLWARRLRGEIKEILQANPYNDI